MRTDTLRLEVAPEPEDVGSGFQVFVGVPWRDRRPPELAEEVCAALARPPGRWRAEWHAVRPDRPGPPEIARHSWRPFVR